MQQAGKLNRWRWLSDKNQHQDCANDIDSRSAVLAKEISVHPLVARLLLLRGIFDKEKAEDFLQPKLSHLHDPALLPGAVKAAKRVAQAIENDEPIVIYGDYDVDGVTATSILYHVLTKLGASVKSYIPHRMDEGYGLNEEAVRKIIDWCNESGDDGGLGRSPTDTSSTVVPVIISVDCGITAVGPARVAKDLGADLIISDHHTFDTDNLPDAFALVHPRLDSEQKYPCAHLCGAGVAFKLAWQIAKEYCASERLPKAISDLMVDLLSYVALGTVADVVPLVDENRTLTMFGLGRINHTRFEGLNALIEAARLKNEKIDAYHIGFVLGPRLNACGRMGHAKKAVRLLTQSTGNEAREMAEFLTNENDSRRQTERSIFKQAKQIIEETGAGSADKRALVVAKGNWHTGVVGIVASRLVETYHRPTIMLNVEGSEATGSARSVEGISIYDALKTCSDLLIKFGGHSMAAGLTLKTENIEKFRDRFIDFVNSKLSEHDLVPWLNVDSAIDFNSCTVEVFQQFKQLAPFGQGNPAPRLLLEKAQLATSPRRVGKGGEHLSLLLRNDNQMLKAIGFNMGAICEQLVEGMLVDIVFKPKVTTWRNRTQAELHIEDIAVSQGNE